MGCTTKGFHGYNDGHTEISIKEETCPQGFMSGRLKYTEAYKKQLSEAHTKNHFHGFTDGKIEIQATNCPIGFGGGRLPIKDESREKMRENHSGGRPIGITKIQNKNLSQTLETRLKIKNKLQGHPVSNRTKNKIKNTLASLECQSHRHNTLSKNNSFNTSKPEDLFYRYLLKIFTAEDIFRQYRDNRYPFNCDFYIKSIDTFIELNLSGTHGGKLFDKNSSADLEKLTLGRIKAKKSNYYKNAIKTGIERDIYKYSTALNNKLNYLIAYNQKDIEKILSSLR